MDGQKVWLIARLIVVSIIGVYIFILFYFSISQARFIYFPERTLISNPAEIGLEYEAVYFKTADNVKLSAWFIPAKDSKKTVLFCHGNAGNISHRLESIRIFNNIGVSTLIFDYRGYGKSEGKPDEKGTYLDAEAAWRYLVKKKQIDPSNIIIFGRSLGGAIAAWLAQKHVPKALIIESVFTSIQDFAAEIYPFLPVKLLLRFNYSAIDYLRDVNCPVLIVHSRDDRIISFSFGQRLFEAANKPKEFLEISGSHNDGFLISAKRYEYGIESFIYRNNEK